MMPFTPVALALLVTSASAQETRKPNLEGEKILARFARCAVRGAPADARALLETTPHSTAESALIQRFMGKRLGCMKIGVMPGTRFVARGETVRGAIAKQLYLDSAGDWTPGAPSTVTTDVTESPDAYSVVRCATQMNPVAADRLVRAERLSVQEAAAARALASALNRCRGGRGKLDISGTAIHGWAAEALYKLRRSDAPKVH